MSRCMPKAVMVALCVLAGCASSENENQAVPRPDRLDRSEFSDLLNAKAVPSCFFDTSIFFAFSDLGAWHGFLLPDPDEPQSIGGFSGPLLHSVSLWLGTSFLKLKLEDVSGNPLELELRDSDALTFLPGMLSQRIEAGSVSVSLDLIFADDRTALVQLRLAAPPDRPAGVRVGWEGSVFSGVAALEARQDGGVTALLTHDKYGGNAHVVFPSELNVKAVLDPADSSWEAWLGQPVSVAAGREWQMCVAVPFYTTQEEREARESLVPPLFNKADQLFAENETRWNGYLSRVLPQSNRWAADSRYCRLAVKAVMTLVDNWRSAARDQLHGGVWPNSAPLVGYHGFWAWDSWKHAVVLARFEPDLAKDQIRAMFDYQNQRGMVPDTVNFDSTKIYWGCTKPPLATWAVVEVYKQTGDRAFLEEMLPALTAYHRWRYAERDHDRNGLCEFGSTNGLYVNGRNESGMDNAVRFDDARMVWNGPGASSLDQESVDLNAYLYADKLYLAEIEDVLGDSTSAAELRKEAASVASAVRAKMFDGESGYFYDIRLGNKSLVTVQGPEGWTPLWTGVATADMAEAVRRIMVDPKKFATYLPFPTVAADNPKFDPESGYWRGLVWLDQAWFGVQGLRRYGYETEATEMIRLLFERTDGALDSTNAFRENYNPLTGAGAGAQHFSWTAAHLLMWFYD